MIPGSFSLNFKITSYKISTFVNPMMSRHKEIMWGSPPVQVHQGSLQHTAANTGVFGNYYAAMNKKESLQWKRKNNNKHRGL